MGGMTWRKLLFWSAAALVAFVPVFWLGYALDAPVVVIASALLFFGGAAGLLAGVGWGGYRWVQRG